MKDIKKLAKELMECTTEETLALKKELEETYGLEMYAPQVPVVTEEKVEEVQVQTSFTLILKEAGPQKVKAMAAFKPYANISLTQIKELFDTVPSNLKENISKGEAEEIKAILEEKGAVVEIM